MSIPSTLPVGREQGDADSVRPKSRSRKSAVSVPPYRFAANIVEIDAPYRNAELFYLQKQIQSQTPMVIVLEDGEMVEGRIEWYDRNTLKVRGRWKTLIYKSAIKYMYKLGDTGRQSFNS